MSLPFTTDAISRFRADTPGVQQRIHLNNAGASFMPLPVTQAITDHLALENQLGGYEAAATQTTASQAFYDEAAKMLHTQARHIAYQTSSTDAYNRAITSIPWEKGDYILTTRDDYVSNQIAFMQIRDRFGIQVVRAADAVEGGVDVDDLRRLMDQLHPRLVAVTHIPSNSGLVQPVREIGSLCRERNLLYLVDACQSIGQMPVNVNQIHCDFLTASLRKFLRGPRGSGFLYVSDRILQNAYEPLVLDLHSARWTAPDAYESVPDAKRFELWERSYAIQVGAAAAMAYANAIGLDRIQERIVALSQYLRDHFHVMPHVRVLDRGQQLGGLVSVAFDHLVPEDLQATLYAAGINSSVSYLDYARLDLTQKKVSQTLRLSPHYYNTFAELDRCVDLIREQV